MIDFSNSELSFKAKVKLLVSEIPYGQVLSYGDVAILIGHFRAARQVGMALRNMSEDHSIPWQRVINAQGKISTYKLGIGELQRKLLEQEGIVFNHEGKVDLAKYRWHPQLSKKVNENNE